MFKATLRNRLCIKHQVHEVESKQFKEKENYVKHKVLSAK